MMYIDILNGGSACSTLTLFDIPRDVNTGIYGDTLKNIDNFKERLVTIINNWNNIAKRNKENGYGSTYLIKDFAFVFASTVRDQSKAEKYLEELGFSPTIEQYNNKNGTIVKLWTIPVGQLLKELDYK